MLSSIHIYTMFTPLRYFCTGLTSVHYFYYPTAFAADVYVCPEANDLASTTTHLRSRPVFWVPRIKTEHYLLPAHYFETALKYIWLYPLPTQKTQTLSTRHLAPRHITPIIFAKKSHYVQRHFQQSKHGSHSHWVKGALLTLLRGGCM